MDKTILNLLFNYNGTISYREFRVGISVIFMLAGTYMSSFFNQIHASIIAGRISSEWLASNVLYNQLTNSFTPNLVPVWFIVSYSSFALAMKRVRMLNNSRTIAIASGITNYLFFASFIALLTIGVFLADTQQNEICRYITPILIYIIIAFFVIGVANLIYLYTRRGAEQSCSFYQKGRLDVSEYSIKMGNLMGVLIIISIIISVILFLSDFANTILISGLCSLIPLFFYIKYSIYRLRDANISIFWLVGVLIVYFIMFGLKILTNLHFPNNLTLYYNTLFAIVTSFFIATQYILFLLPTKNEKMPTNNDNACQQTGYFHGS